MSTRPADTDDLLFILRVPQAKLLPVLLTVKSNASSLIGRKEKSRVKRRKANARYGETGIYERKLSQKMEVEFW